MTEHSTQRPSGVVTRANLDPYLADSTRKQQLVTPLFDLIAPHYDRFTRVFSYGMDARWKRELVAWLLRHHGTNAAVTVLDVACGTGDLAIQTAQALPNANVRGVDLSERMLELARTRLPATLHHRLTFEVGDLGQLPARDASIDVVTAGYAIRNAPDPRQALGEVARVLRPGGHLYVLDFFRPPAPLWRALYLSYLRAAGAAVGWWWHRTPAAYEYIAASIAHFVSCAEFAEWLLATGFSIDWARPKLGGGVALIAAVRR
ncbi:MAG: ubiquinone/menaquinone biosynthesis methyltransferase [Gemmatimonadaceae bacterium]